MNTDEHAVFNESDNTLIVYIGQSPANFYKKWEIPLKAVDEESIVMEGAEYSGHPLTIKVLDDQCLFKFYEENEFEKCTNQFSYYPGATNGSKPGFRNKFVLAFKEAVEKSKINEP